MYIGVINVFIYVFKSSYVNKKIDGKYNEYIFYIFFSENLQYICCGKVNLKKNKNITGHVLDKYQDNLRCI